VVRETRREDLPRFGVTACLRRRWLVDNSIKRQGDAERMRATPDRIEQPPEEEEIAEREREDIEADALARHAVERAEG
jgi:hypothetical protein